MILILRRDWEMWTAPFGRRYGNMKCPRCRRDLSLSEHKVDDQGRVTPSIVCPHCGLHEFVQLDDWPG